MAIRVNWANGEQWNAADQNELNAAVLAARSVTSVTRTDGYLQFFTGTDPLGDPIYLEKDVIDGGTASTSSLTTFDGGTP